MTVEGHIENGQIVFNEHVSLPEGARVRVELLSTSGNISRTLESRIGSNYEHYQSIIVAIDDLPPDFAAEHDHYIHGTPKK